MSSRLGASTIILPMVAMLLLAACAGQLQIPAQEGGGAAPPQSGEVAASWQAGAAMPTARSEMRVAVVDGIFYVPGGFGGLTSFEAYDPANDSWTVLAPVPEPAHHMMVTGHSGKVFVFGGGPDLSWQATASIFVYDPATDAWAEAGSMPERRMSGEAVSLGDFIYLVGGTGGTTALLRYDPAEGSWAVMPGPCSRASTWRRWLSTTSCGSSAGVGAGRARWRRWRYSIRPAARGGTVLRCMRRAVDLARPRWATASWLRAARFSVRGRGRPLPALRCMTRSRARGRCCRTCRRAFMGCLWPVMRGRRSFWAGQTRRGD